MYSLNASKPIAVLVGLTFLTMCVYLTVLGIAMRQTVPIHYTVIVQTGGGTPAIYNDVRDASVSYGVCRFTDVVHNERLETNLPCAISYSTIK